MDSMDKRSKEVWIKWPSTVWNGNIIIYSARYVDIYYILPIEDISFSSKHVHLGFVWQASHLEKEALIWTSIELIWRTFRIQWCALRVDRTKVRVFQQTNQIRFSYFLNGLNSCSSELQVCFVVLSDLSYYTLKRTTSNKQFSGLLISTDFS